MHHTIFYSQSKRKLIFLLLFLPWIFLGLVSVVSSGLAVEFDRLVFQQIKAFKQGPLGAPWLIEAARDVTALGSITVLSVLSLCVAGFFLVLKDFARVSYVLGTVAGAFTVSTFLKSLFERARPGAEEHLTQVFTSSFPSAHAMHSAAIYLMLGALIADFQENRFCKIYTLWLAIGLTLAVGLSRVYLGVHWPTDIFAGWAAGAIWALFSSFIAYSLSKKIYQAGS